MCVAHFLSLGFTAWNGGWSWHLKWVPVVSYANRHLPPAACGSSSIPSRSLQLMSESFWWCLQCGSGRSCWNVATTLGPQQAKVVLCSLMPSMPQSCRCEQWRRGRNSLSFLCVTRFPDAEAVWLLAPCTWFVGENMSSNIYLQPLKSRGSIQNLFSLRIILRMLVLESGLVATPFLRVSKPHEALQPPKTQTNHSINGPAITSHI